MQNGGGMGFLITNLLFFAIFIGLFYFLLIRPERKRRQEHQKFIQSLKKGDKVITSAGILGTIEQVEEDYVVLKCEGTTKCKILKEHIVGYQPEYAVKKTAEEKKED
jgi:preprotein translocase subunit YajC